MATATQYYVFSDDTMTGINYVISTNPAWDGPGVKVGGPFTTNAAAQAFIKNGSAAKGLSSTVLSQDQADVGQWIVVPEGEAGDIVNALSYVGNTLPSDLLGVLKGDVNVGSGTTYTVVQLTTAQQVENAETASLPLYPTKAAAQAAATTTNKSNNPSPGAGSLTTFLDFITSENGWKRVAKIVVGSAMILIGLFNLTGTDKAVATAAKGAIL
jgi:hypothetical protein